MAMQAPWSDKPTGKYVVGAWVRGWDGLGGIIDLTYWDADDGGRLYVRVRLDRPHYGSEFVRGRAALWEVVA